MTTHVFILVHGTFARNAAWVGESSDLCRALLQAFPRSKAVVFGWSGRNTHSARLSAAVNLGREILAAAKEFPNAKVHVVAHSHGGNIAFYACRNPDVENCVTSVICIATPFIICGLRNLEWLTHRLFSVTAGMVIVGLMLFYLAVASEWKWGISFFAIGFVTWLGYVLVDLIRLNLYPQWLKRFERRQKAIFDRLSLPALRVPVWVVRTSRDEASIWLRASHLATTVPNAINRYLYAIAVLSTVAVLPAYYLFLKPYGYTDILQIYALWFAGLLAAMASYLFIMGVTFLVRANPWVFGWEGIEDGLLVALTVWTAPAFMPFSAFDVKLKSLKFGLRHSALYGDPSVLDQLPRWVEQADLFSRMPSAPSPPHDTDTPK